MSYSVLLIKDDWVFILNKNKILLKCRDVIIADTVDDYMDLINQVTLYKHEKSIVSGERCFVKIQNTNTNTTLVLENHGIPEFYNFLMSIRKNVMLIKRNTSIKICPDSLS